MPMCPSGTLPTDRRFTGQRWEQGLGLYDYNARWYHPALGRFVSADTIVPDPANPQSLNRYAYVSNNPVLYRDPSGHGTIDDLLIRLGRSGPAGKALIVGMGEAVHHVNRQNQRIFYPNADTDPADRLLACAEIGGGAVAFAAVSTEVVLGTLTTAATAGGAAEVVSTGTGVTTAACADGDCTNEVNTAIDAGSRTLEALSADGASKEMQAVQTSTNVVYQYLRGGATRYVGITNNFTRRAGEHFRARGWRIQPILGLEQLSRSDARAVEQVLIEYYGLDNLLNAINSIATTNPTYGESIQRGTEILNQIGFLVE